MRHIAILALLASVASADSGDKKRADKLFADGRHYLQNKEYALACTAFEQSQQADPAIGTQLNIALCYEEWGHVVAALKAFQEAERLAAAKHDNRAKEAHKKVEELGPKVPHLAVRVPGSVDPSAVFLLDGKEIERAALTSDLLLEVGDHAIEVRVPGAPPKTTKLALAIGEHKQVELEVPRVAVAVAPPPPPPAGPPPEPPRKKGRLYGGIAAIGVGGIALGTATFIALVARSDYNSAVASCPDFVCTTRQAYLDTQAARSHADDASIIAVSGSVVAAVGVWLVLTSHGDRPKDRVTAAPLVQPGMVGVTIGGPL